MKRIICLNEDCTHNKYGHCMKDKNYIMIDDEGFCKDFETKNDYKERINATMQTETKADLKDAEKVRLASKREEK